MQAYIRNTNHTINRFDLICSFLLGVNIMGVIGMQFFLDSTLSYLLFCGLGGILFLLISLSKRYIFLKQVTVQNTQLVFKTHILFLSYKYSCQIENIKITRTYYSLVLRCNRPNKGEEIKKFKLSSSNWKELEDLERLILSSKKRAALDG
ncbi:hypothetical protein [Flammeovirga aprica]|uniref:Uncharacterized protein n=1 Tax=Flammeovirga aprica JL-4 TaxID=694437 RepID=A0A7X9XCW1_9BACT|nr:hypothetical protein [Flammeovirga aprica]NME72145.1 hypothetical protein [Flammeovirga aprica JL-4]